MPHVTRTWHTSKAAAVPREWTQHFQLPGEGGKPYCLTCVRLLMSPAPDSPFCCEKCAATFRSAGSQRVARSQLFERDRGVCALCRFDAHGFYKQLAALPTE